MEIRIRTIFLNFNRFWWKNWLLNILIDFWLTLNWSTFYVANCSSCFISSSSPNQSSNGKPWSCLIWWRARFVGWAKRRSHKWHKYFFSQLRKEGNSRSFRLTDIFASVDKSPKLLQFVALEGVGVGVSVRINRRHPHLHTQNRWPAMLFCVPAFRPNTFQRLNRIFFIEWLSK